MKTPSSGEQNKWFQTSRGGWHRSRSTATQLPLFSVQPCGILFLHYQDHQTKFISNLWKYWTTAALNCHPDATCSREPPLGRAHFFFLKASWSLLKELNGPSPTSQAFSCASLVCFSGGLQEKEGSVIKKSGIGVREDNVVEGEGWDE